MLEHGHSPEEIAQRIGEAGKPSHLRDVIYGAVDGAVTTFAIVAGVVGAELSTKVIIALGIANVLADGFSMAAGNYSGTKAELDDARRLRAIEERHVRETPEGERAELREILAQKGLDGDTLDAAVNAIARNRTTWIDMMLVEEYGLSPVDPHPMRAAQATFFAFLVAGMVPLLPWLFETESAFQWSIAMTGLTFFGVGALKSRWSLARWWRSGFETLAIGGVAAAIAYFVGTLFA
ncbi:MAG: VIT1/CCC1 transporter family protein [Pseudomonadota bacterium]